MANALKSAIFFAKVVTSDISNAIKVSVPKYKMDERLTMYFKEHTFLYAEDPSKKCKEGDYVIVRELPPESQNKNITHVVEQLVYERGNYIDPLTGKKCAGTEFVEDIKRTSALFGIERPYQKLI
ncbi:28S ribosomal protein S17, mitochondrial-like [Argiope bruennichi]|uniref:28S ribosomal protein S17 like protein n=1 Tax=Argiope bruennichi TaxID=94029 RepID=A0A8T0FEP1_ARGBR|nr:28S ribosomal protein S17, mitochondrial-like [Argiope bruennichi]KAF8787393.1 28S ribosomal protein S17 like protein [Argiope bruennichi]